MFVGKRALLLIGACVVLAALGYWFAVYRPQRELKQLGDAAAWVQLAVERYAVDKEGVYPRDLQQLVDEGYLTALPDSPYGGKVKLLRLDEPAEPGGVHYIPVGPVIFLGDVDADRDGSNTVPMEVDQYTLIIYKQRAGKPKSLPDWAGPELLTDLAGHGPTWDEVDANIDHARIALVLTAGEDYIPDR